MKNMTRTLVSSSIVLAATAALYGEEPAGKPAAQPSASSAPAAPESGTVASLFDKELPDVIGKSKIIFNSRLRWEWADQAAVPGGVNPDDSNAFTVRTRFGLLSGDLYGFHGMIEGENVSVLGPTHNYNAAGSNGGGAGRTIIADPPTTELNQAWVSYNRWDTVARAGRQRLVLDNQRFVGDVNWRQNQQTFDAATVENRSIENLTLLYSYLWEVNRVFGDVDGLPDVYNDFSSSSHILNASYKACEAATVTAYTYLLDLDNGSAAGPVNSTASYGISVTGKVPAHEKVDVNYRGEFAWQNDYADNDGDYGTPYYLVEAGATIKPVLFGAGYEVLSSDDGSSFRTPLATLHAFNGWADVFLNTPVDGLRDIYGYAGVTLPGKVPLRGIFHKFNADEGDNDYGWEFDIVASRKLGSHWAALAKYAHYDGKDIYPDVERFWLQLEFIY